MAVTFPAGGATGTRNDQINYYVNLLNSQFPGNLTGRNETLAEYYVQYLESHPSADPGFTYDSVVARLQAFQSIPGNLGGDIGTALQKTGQVSQSIGPAAGAAAQNLQVPGLSGIDAIGNFFNKLGQKNTWIRIGEGIVAIILLDVGLKAFTGKSVIESTGKTITGGTKAAAKTAIFK